MTRTIAVGPMEIWLIEGEPHLYLGIIIEFIFLLGQAKQKPNMV